MFDWYRVLPRDKGLQERRDSLCSLELNPYSSGGTQVLHTSRPFWKSLTVHFFNTCWIFGLFKALFEISHGKCFTCLSALLLCNLLCCREKCAFLNTEVVHCHYVAAICLLADEKKGLINAGWRRRHRLSWPRVRREHWKSEMTSLDTVECTGEDGSKRRRGKERREEVEAVRSVSGRSVTFLRPMATQPPTLSGRRGVSAAGNRGLDMILSSSRLQSCGFVSHTACSWQHWPLADLAFVQS